MGSMFGKNKKLSSQQTQLYSQQTQLQPYVIQQIHDAFTDRAGKNGRMNVNEFKIAYPQINPNANMYNMDMDAERFFMMFDTDRNGKRKIRTKKKEHCFANLINFS
ncbi:unnamed protein product [Adineta steineri]|uniref:EF-hand domain-containing protein n=1 Tax=Adineta steineri TaxID=433720 RepID=A0A814XCL4_9BILA|nr:unnamed protein product [Adineta steineri]CAF1496090.1 unnamed protein product [Adineta steineri]